MEKPLSEWTLSVCRLLSAKWVSRKEDGRVCFWTENPTTNSSVILLGFVRADFFPSIKPGDCICVEELQKNECY